MDFSAASWTQRTEQQLELVIIRSHTVFLQLEKEMKREKKIAVSKKRVLFFKKSIFQLQLVYNIIVVSGVQHSD